MTDVYSFGITLFEIFTRLEPYEEYQDVQDVVERLGDSTMEPPLRPSLPEGLPAGVRLVTQAPLRAHLRCSCFQSVGALAMFRLFGLRVRSRFALNRVGAISLCLVGFLHPRFFIQSNKQ